MEKHGKTIKRFPTAFPKTLEIDKADSHIPSALRLIISLKIKTRKDLPSCPIRYLQAHLSIGKDWAMKNSLVTVSARC